MKIIDYIHYYFGCQCLEAIKVPGQELNFEPSTITVRTLFNVQSQLSEVKLVLRRLEDMTEEEAANLAVIYSGAKKVSPMKGIASNWHYFFCYFSEDQEGEVLVIDATGCAWYAHYFDKSQPGHRNIVDEHKAFHYLLQNHFDLFGLVDAGLAIDAKTIDK